MVTEIVYFECGDKKYPAYCSLNVLEWMQNKFGTLNEFMEKLSGGDDGEVPMGLLIDSFTEVINEGIDYQNEMNGTKDEFVTRKQAARIVSAVGFDAAAKKLAEMMGVEETEDAEIEDGEIPQVKNAKSRAKK